MRLASVGLHATSWWPGRRRWLRALTRPSTSAWPRSAHNLPSVVAQAPEGRGRRRWRVALEREGTRGTCRGAASPHRVTALISCRGPIAAGAATKGLVAVGASRRPASSRLCRLAQNHAASGAAWFEGAPPALLLGLPGPLGHGNGNVHSKGGSTPNSRAMRAFAALAAQNGALCREGGEHRWVCRTVEQDVDADGLCLDLAR